MKERELEMISLICVSNNYDKLNTILKSSLSRQKDVKYELIIVDSNKYGFNSAAEALNFGGKQAKGDYLFFVHQDISFQDDFELAKLESYCRNFIFGVAGVAGVKNIEGKVVSFSNIFHGDPKTKAASKSISSPVEVDAIDECLIIIPKKVFSTNQFSIIGLTWHLYGTDYALQMKLINLPVLVFPSELWHVSDGKSLNLNYFDAIQWLLKKYSKNYSAIYTFFGVWPSNPILLKFKCLYRKLRFYIKGV